MKYGIISALIKLDLMATVAKSSFRNSQTSKKLKKNLP